MEIVKLSGEDQRLFSLIAHLITDKNVLQYNLNYPYKTSKNHAWFIAVEENNTLGFIPVELKGGRAVINNYYIANDNNKVFSTLLQTIADDLLPEFKIESITQIRHIPNFEQCGFSIYLRWKRYVKMQKYKNEKKCI
jgi:hypothetical protein